MLASHSDSFRASLSSFLRSVALPADKFGHQPRLYALTQHIGQGLDYDDDVVFAAAFLHDLGVFIGQRPEDPEQLRQWDHVAYTLRHAPTILRRAGFPEARIPAVLQAIATHQPQDTPTSLEATILRDADILEQLGAIGILRAVAKTGRDTRYPDFSSVVPFLRRNLDQLPSAIRLPTTRTLAAPKLALLQVFIEGVEAESYNALF